MTPNILTKLESVLAADFAMAENNIIAPNLDGGYHVFGMFDIKEKDDVVEVIRASNLVRSFSSMRLALSWCIAQKYQQIHLSRDIERLDLDYTRLNHTGKTLQSVLSHMRDADRRAITRAKTEDNAWRLAQVQNQLAKCVMRAKYLQIRGFNDEIARTRRPTPHRTSRPGHRKSNRPAN